MPSNNYSSRLFCTAHTEVQYFDSRNSSTNSEVLDDKALSSKFPAISDFAAGIGRNSIETNSSLSKPHFVLMSAIGDPTDKSFPLHLSSDLVHAFTNHDIFNSYLIFTYQLKQPHFSYHILYDHSNQDPIAIVIYLRLFEPPYILHIAQHIHLATLSSFSLLTSTSHDCLSHIQSRSAQELHLVQSHPFQLLNFIIERRTLTWQPIVTGFGTHVIYNRYNALAHDPVKGLRGLCKDGKMLMVMQSHISNLAGLGKHILDLIQKIDDLREQSLNMREREMVEGPVRFNETVLRNMQQTVENMVGRLKLRATMTSSLISQNSSEQNLRIAEITAKDSRTMKAITILTLVFLPPTMLASLWDANIFTLPPYLSWRIYLGTSIALTSTVFATFILYIWFSARSTVVQCPDLEMNNTFVITNSTDLPPLYTK